MPGRFTTDPFTGGSVFGPPVRWDGKSPLPPVRPLPGIVGEVKAAGLSPPPVAPGPPRTYPAMQPRGPAAVQDQQQPLDMLDHEFGHALPKSALPALASAKPASSPYSTDMYRMGSHVNEPAVWEDNPGKMMGRNLIGGYINGPTNMANDLNDAFAEQSNINADRVTGNNRLAMILDALGGIGNGSGGGGMTGFQDQNSPQGGNLPGQYRSTITTGALPQQTLNNAAAGVQGQLPAGQQMAMTKAGNVPLGIMGHNDLATLSRPGGPLAGVPLSSWGSAGSTPAASGMPQAPQGNIMASPQALAGLQGQFGDNMAREGALSATGFGRAAGAANAKLGLSAQEANASQGGQLAQLLAGLNQDNLGRDLQRRQMLLSTLRGIA